MESILEMLPREYLPQVREYLSGKRRSFSLRVPLNGTEFQNAVWRAMLDIPYGETRSYKQIAETIGRPKAFRAVANACGKNPYPIIIPCHRVVASNGIGGFSLGLKLKKQLLKFEES
jgi:methylated-DNA-[protein]-cysteine S-methyltransferase